MKNQGSNNGENEFFFKEIVNTHFKDSYAHGRLHVLRVVKWVKRLAKELEEGGTRIDREILIAAAYLHDLGRLEHVKPLVQSSPPPDLPHAERSAILAREILSGREVFSPEQIKQVEHAILAHSFSLGTGATTPEAKILSDADKLDAVGAQGIIRTLAWSIENQRSFPEMVQHFNEKILLLKDCLHTGPAKKIAVGKQELLELFMKDLIDSSLP